MGTVHKCEPNHVAHLKETLSEVTGAMRISQHSVRIINGKVVYLFKITDQLNSKLNILGKNLKKVDHTFADWKDCSLKSFQIPLKKLRNHENGIPFKYTAEVNRRRCVHCIS